MVRFDINVARKALEARSLNERALLLVTFVAVVGYLWLVLVFDPVSAAQQEARQQTVLINAQILEQQARLREIQDSYSDDPDAFARTRLGMLQEDTMEVDARLNELYGKLIPPREMSMVLTSILQKETELRLVSLENIPPVSMFQSDVAPVPLVGAAPEPVQATQGAGLRVFRHGLRLVFEGGYLETLRYMSSLEELDSNFFWEDLSLTVQEYPSARITLQIYTLSTQEEWIGV